MLPSGKIEKCKEFISSADVETDNGKLEDDQIQSSLPFYLEHLFGQRVGGNSPLLECTTSPSPSGPILDSQGFLTSAGNSTSRDNVISNTRSPINLSSLPSVGTEGDDPVPEGGVANSPLLFPSPDPVDTIVTTDSQNSTTKLVIGHDSTDIAISDIPNAPIKLQNTDDACDKVSDYFKTPKARLTGGNKTKRGKKRKLSTGSLRDEYVCPPGAVSLKDCSLKDYSLKDCFLKQGTVSVLAIVVQGQPASSVLL